MGSFPNVLSGRIGSDWRQTNVRIQLRSKQGQIKVRVCPCVSMCARVCPCVSVCVRVRVCVCVCTMKLLRIENATALTRWGYIAATEIPPDVLEKRFIGVAMSGGVGVCNIGWSVETTYIMRHGRAEP